MTDSNPDLNLSISLDELDAFASTLSLSGDGEAPVADKVFDHSNLIGREIGNVKLLQCLGAGGFGAVFRGHEQALEIDVAVKIPLGEETRTEKFRDFFLQEARAVARLDHFHIVRVMRIDEHEGINFIVMEFVKGTDVSSLINSRGRLSFGDAAKVCIAGAKALEHAHKHGIVHRDIKPHNILVNDDLTIIKLADFGLARLSESDSSLKRDGLLMGTPAYMSPEQDRRETVTDKTDIFSLGVSLLHMISGVLPRREPGQSFGHEELSSIDDPLLEEALAETPQELLQLIGAMCHQVPDRRPSPGEVVIRLGDFLNSRGRAVGPSLADREFRRDTESNSVVLQPAKTNLRRNPTSFIGRTRELEEAGNLLDDENVQLLTIVGPGGMGKTRLVRQLGALRTGRFN
ncbi:MAG: serine/threonine-protein kinase, partial [Nitrospira sp.]|nr:serine/threonine-protein kinase [Nitrospira sp.]